MSDEGRHRHQINELTSTDLTSDVVVDTVLFLCCCWYIYCLNKNSTPTFITHIQRAYLYITLIYILEQWLLEKSIYRQGINICKGLKRIEIYILYKFQKNVCFCHTISWNASAWYYGLDYKALLKVKSWKWWVKNILKIIPNIFSFDTI